MSFILEVFVAFVIALFVTNFTEWATHKWILHGLGKKKNSWFNYHWAHHNVSRKNGFHDEDYDHGFFESWAVRREILGLVLMLASNINWYFVWPVLFFWFCFFTIAYYLIHKYSHQYPEFTKKYLRWHWDHHMGIDQNKNWGVTSPLWDYILGTRVKYEYDENNRPIKNTRN